MPAVKPITPEEALLLKKPIPDEVFEAFNELICEDSSTVSQREVVERIVKKMPNVTPAQVYEKGWLNVEEFYRAAGWDVVYDRNDRIQGDGSGVYPFFEFKSRR